MTLWTKLIMKEENRSPHRRTLQIPERIRRASFYTCKKASYTLEAAVVIPLMAGYLVMLLFFFSILEIQCEVDEALLYAGRKTAVESSVIEEEELLFLSAKAYLLYALDDYSLVQKYVKSGAWGIQLWGSEFAGEDIFLRATYEIELPISFLGIERIELSSQSRFRKWNGDRILEEEGDYVYITPTGEVYHANLTCRSINLSVKPTSIGAVSSLRGKNGQKYYECSRCDWKDSKKERVYYTDYGTLYHKDIACSSIKRTVEKIKKEAVTERRPCSFCYK